jgi:rubrerythrin
MEANGTFSLVEEDAPRPGLSVIPGWDEDFRQLQPVAAGQFACVACGQVEAAAQKPARACPHCGAQEWHQAVEALK